ncbi:coiled-coil domain-containing protein [Candidatus Wolbachia massiliensis]|uniref:Uncharacterized protein n=1 Tax=Candidatus Wolbachia massiliensis TaxID=1845000 RepID=A0A7L7YQW0_9RICK|nr:hypothetical protein [Candidatus Wolbachia massiliensis]QOD38146.1 hypothetical protein ID128_05045 [Candidatus Wolbachia massiliensis]
MPEEDESVFVAENQSLNVDETARSSVLSIIETSNSFQKAVKKLEEEKLIWYFIGPLCKDEEFRKQISLKWEADFQEFEQSVKKIYEKFKPLLPDQSFLAYSIKDNNFNIRFDNEEKPIKISDILKASNKGEVYNISLGKDSLVTACKKNGNERHYDFAGSGLCEMTINWQAIASEGKSIGCSITVEVGSDGIQRVIGEPKFGSLKFTDPLSEEIENKVLELVKQNKEVFINGKTLYQAFTDMGRSVDDQQMLTEEIPVSPQSPTPDSSGYFSPGTPSSRRSSVSVSGEVSGEDEVFESDTFDDKEKLWQEEGLADKIRELEERNTYLEKKNKELESRNKGIIGEGDKELDELMEEKQILEEKVKRLEAELERKTRELAGKDQDIEQLKQKVSILEKELQDKSNAIKSLNDQLKDMTDEIQSTNKINEELQKKLEQKGEELNTLKEENTRLKSDVKKMVEDLVEDDKGKQLAKQLLEIEKENKELTDTVSQLAEELNKLQKEKEALEMANQQHNIGEKSLADELNEGNVKVATSTQTEMSNESKGIQASIQENDLSKAQDQSIQEAQPQNIMDWPTPIPDDKPEEQQTPLELTKVNKTNKTAENIMDWPTPIPDGKPEEQQTPLEPAKINTEVSDPNSTLINDGNVQKSVSSRIFSSTQFSIYQERKYQAET